MEIYTLIAQIIYSLAILAVPIYCLVKYHKAISQNWKANEAGLQKLVFSLLGVYFFCLLGAMVISLFELGPTSIFMLLLFYLISALLPAVIIVQAQWKERFPARDAPVTRKSSVKIGMGAGLILVAVAFGLAAIWPTEVTESEMFSEFGDSISTLLLFSIFALLAAVVEEIIFRLGMQRLLEKVFPEKWVIIPILITSVIFALGHAGAVEQPFFKEIQIMITSIVFGFLRIRYGMIGCTTAHMTMNFVVVGLALIGYFVG
jgi:membrane protease YdiL (CAAX protease family)